MMYTPTEKQERPKHGSVDVYERNDDRDRDHTIMLQDERKRTQPVKMEQSGVSLHYHNRTQGIKLPAVTTGSTDSHKQAKLGSKCLYSLSLIFKLAKATLSTSGAEPLKTSTRI